MSRRSVGRYGKKFAAPQKMIGATSPAPRLTAKMTPVRIPPFALEDDLVDGLEARCAEGQ